MDKKIEKVLSDEELSSVSGGANPVIESCPKCGSKNIHLELKDPRHCGQHHCKDCDEYF